MATTAPNYEALILTELKAIAALIVQTNSLISNQTTEIESLAVVVAQGNNLIAQQNGLIAQMIDLLKQIEDDVHPEPGPAVNISFKLGTPVPK